MDHDGGHAHEREAFNEAAETDSTEITQAHVTTLQGHESEVWYRIVQ